MQAKQQPRPTFAQIVSRRIRQNMMEVNRNAADVLQRALDNNEKYCLFNVGSQYSGYIEQLCDKYDLKYVSSKHNDGTVLIDVDLSKLR